MVVGLACEFCFKFAGIGSAGGECKTSTQCVGAVRFRGEFGFQQLPGVVITAQLHQDVDGVETNGFVVRLFPTRIGKEGQRFVQLAFTDQSGSFFAWIAAGSGGQGKTVEEGAHLALRQGAVELIDQLSLKEHLDGWDAAHAEMLGELRVFVGIDLGEKKAPLIFIGQLFEQRFQCLTGTTPRRPEVHYNGNFQGGLENLCLEFFDGDVKMKLGHGGFLKGIEVSGILTQWRRLADSRSSCQGSPLQRCFRS